MHLTYKNAQRVRRGLGGACCLPPTVKVTGRKPLAVCSAGGVLTEFTKVAGKTAATPCHHSTGIEQDMDSTRKPSETVTNSASLSGRGQEREGVTSLSVLDQSPVSEGFTPADALHNSIDLARAADRLGYRRYWVAEHHAIETLASPAPEVLIARIGAETSAIRIGSGGILLPHYSPLKVAEVFRMLHALYPGRMDLGVGRAPGSGGLEAFALQRDRTRRQQGSDFPQQLMELEGFLHHNLPRNIRLARSRFRRKCQAALRCGCWDRAPGARISRHNSGCLMLLHTSSAPRKQGSAGSLSRKLQAVGASARTAIHRGARRGVRGHRSRGRAAGGEHETADPSHPSGRRAKARANSGRCPQGIGKSGCGCGSTYMGSQRMAPLRCRRARQG